MLPAMFMAWALLDARRKGFRFQSEALHYTLKEKLATLPRVLPLILIILGMLFVLYGGVAKPSEAAGAGAMLTLLVVIVVYRLFMIKTFVGFLGSSLLEIVMILMIMASSDLFRFSLF